MDIHPVSSKETMLNEKDIVLVASHMSDQSQVKEAAQQHGITPERMLYTIYLQQMQEPALIRIRDGNTLFTIAAMPERYGYVSVYNGDTQENVATNFVNFLQAAYKMGFNVLAVSCGDNSLNEGSEEIQSMYQDAEFAFDSKQNLLLVKFNQPHGD